jgi:alpha-D-xyloside xylohydrolase
VRDGGIIPMAATTSLSNGKYDLIIRHYGEKESEYNLYDDDGITFNYEKGDFTWRKISVKHNKKGQLKGTILPAEKGKPDNIGKVEWDFR